MHRAALWMPQQEPGGIPSYWRLGSGGYNLRRVFEPGRGRVLNKHWALFKGRFRVWELQSMADRDGAMAQAEQWLQEHDIVKHDQPGKDRTDANERAEHRPQQSSR